MPRASGRTSSGASTSAEAAVVRRMFELCADGRGPDAHHQDAQRRRRAGTTPAARAPGRLGHQLRAGGAAAAALSRVRSSGTRRASAIGGASITSTPGRRPSGCGTPAPALRIVSDDLWARAQQQLATRTARYVGGRPLLSRQSRYLLSGFARCALCGGGFASHGRMHGKHRVQFYACIVALEARRRRSAATGSSDAWTASTRRCSPRCAMTSCAPPWSSGRSRWRSRS